MKFVSFRLGIAKTEGPEVALQLQSTFDELELVRANQPFMFENMPTIKKVEVFLNTTEEAAAVGGSEKARADAVPSKPSIMFLKQE